MICNASRFSTLNSTVHHSPCCSRCLVCQSDTQTHTHPGREGSEIQSIDTSVTLRGTLSAVKVREIISDSSLFISPPAWLSPSSYLFLGTSPSAFSVFLLLCVWGGFGLFLSSGRRLVRARVSCTFWARVSVNRLALFGSVEGAAQPVPGVKVLSL